MDYKDGEDRVVARLKQSPTPTLYMMIGIPASGKSSFCRSKPFMGKSISLDRVKTRARELQLIDEAFEHNTDITIDNTNVTRAERAKYIGRAKERGYRVVGYYMQSVLKDCLERNRRRTGAAKVPDKAILSKAKLLEMPSLSEGFDELWYVSMDKGAFNEQTWKEE